MTTKQLVQAIEEQDYILPKSVLKNTTEEQLIQDLEEIFKDYKQRIETEQEFRRKYIELVNFVLIRNLSKEKAKQKKNLFDKNLINYLLSRPEMV